MENHGKVTYNGIEYMLIEEAYADQWGAVRPTYSARAVKADEEPDCYGNRTEYLITWNVKDDFIFFDSYELKWYYIGGEDEVQESDLCDWETPDKIEEF